MDDETNKEGWQRVVDVIRNAVYDYLTPYLRDPVGWELDVSGEEAYKAWAEATGDDIDAVVAVLDLCRSRIKPVFECKECAKEQDSECKWCAKWQTCAENVQSNYEIVSARLDRVRAALEGE